MSDPGEGPTFYRIVEPSGLAFVYVRQTWPQHLAVSAELIKLADEDYVSFGDGLLRFRADDGTDVLYGYAHPEPKRSSMADPDIDHYDLIRPIPTQQGEPKP